MEGGFLVFIERVRIYKFIDGYKFSRNILRAL